MLSAALCLTLTTLAYANQTLVGTIVSAAGAEEDSASTASPFTLRPQTKVDVQCTGSTAVRFKTCPTSTCSAGATDFIGLRDSASQTYQLDPPATHKYVSILPVTAVATTCYFYLVSVN